MRIVFTGLIAVFCGFASSGCVYYKAFPGGSETLNSIAASLITSTSNSGSGSGGGTTGATTPAAPVFSLDPTQPYFSAQSLDLTTTTSGATIHYTMDGTDPDCSSTQYTASINLGAGSETTIKAVSCDTDSIASSITSGDFVLGPIAKGVYNTPTNSYGVHVDNGHAFVADFGGSEFQVIDVSDPAAPGFAGDANNAGNPRNMFVSGNYAYVPQSALGFRIYDISTPSTPVSVFSFDPSTGNAFDTFVTNNTLYFANRDDIFIYDVTNPASATQLGYFNAIGNAFSIVVSGSHAYVGGGGGGLEILDISNPASVSIVGNSPSTNARDVYLSGNYAYVADGVGGLRIVDVSTPTAPSEVGAYSTSMDARGVHVVGDYAYVADNANGLKIFNVSDPTAPTLETTVSTGGVLARGVFVKDGYVYLANDTDGLRIYRVSN